MPTLWTFGDSFTDFFSDNTKWGQKYLGWKTYKPKVYGEILSEELNFNLRNLGVGGYDNYSIFESFIDVVDEINSEDVLIFGWSNVTRFRLVNNNGIWKPIIPNYEDNIKNLENINEDTINQILVNRTNKLYENELNSFIKLINYTFKKNIIVHWSLFNKTINATYVGNIETIRKETNGEVDDGHYSENGQKELSKILMSLYNKKKNRELI